MICMSALLVLLSQLHDPKPFNNFTTSFNHYLVAAEAKSTLSADQLRNSYVSLSHLIRNGYTAYRITYNTTGVNGEAVIASGALFIPDAKEALPLLNYSHGTYFPSDEKKAPSYLSSYNAELQIGKLFSAAGYMVAMPDYIGYGSTKNLEHPYGAYHLIARSGIDMLRAVKEFCERERISLSGKNFFSGWSEGAAVSLAMVKALEADPAKVFIPTAAVLNAGPYYSSAFVEHILDSKKALTYMSTYAWVLQSYNKIYGINKPYQYYFTEPAATRLQKDLEATIPHDPALLFTDTFRQDFKAGKDSLLQAALVLNDLWDWKPAARVVLCHGDRDDYVPLFNSEKVYTEMKKKGADVSLKIFKGHTHSSSAFNFLEQAFATFESMK
jgi:predicted esterase